MRRFLWVATLLRASFPALARRDLSPLQRPSRPMGGTVLARRGLR